MSARPRSGLDAATAAQAASRGRPGPERAAPDAGRPRPAHRALIGRGEVWHKRLRPVEHAFAYPTGFLMLPMRSLRAAPDATLRRNRAALVSFHDADHGEGGPDALAWAERLLADNGVRDADGEIWLQTSPRMLGHAFKPVSFWFAHRADDSLAAVLAEVNNTFGERHVYLLDGPALRWGAEVSARKVFHVSPFNRVAGHYRFRFLRTATGPREHLLARVDLDDDDGPLLQTALSGELQPLTAASLRALVLSRPLMTLGVLARIHWQALKLWRRRVPFFGKPTPPDTLVTR